MRCKHTKTKTCCKNISCSFICSFIFLVFRWGTHLYMSLFLLHTIYQEQYIKKSYTCGKWWSLHMLFSFFLKFSFFGLLVGWKGKKYPKLKNNNCICHVLYLRNSVTYDHDFWYSCVKKWYLQTFLSFFFWNFHFLSC